MTKQPNKRLSIRNRIEANKELITNSLNGASSAKRLNDLNWIKHEFAREAEILFQGPKSAWLESADYTNIQNLMKAWDYIVDNPDMVIDNHEIRNIHRIIACNNIDDIQGGTYRLSDAYIERLKLHAPNFNDLQYRISDIEYHISDERLPVLERAFDVHYDIIAAQLFNDCNKRTARMVMNWILVRGGYRPILFNHKSDKANYMNALYEQAHGDRKAYMLYMYECMERTQKEILKRLGQAQRPIRHH